MGPSANGSHSNDFMFIWVIFTIFIFTFKLGDARTIFNQTSKLNKIHSIFLLDAI